MEEILVLRLVRAQKLVQQANLALRVCDQNTLQKLLKELSEEFDFILSDEDLEEQLTRTL